MSKGIKFSPIFLAATACVILVIYLYWPSDAGSVQKKAVPTSVKIYNTSVQPFDVTVEALGTVTANESISVTTQTTDVIRSISFNDGDVVKKNQQLLTLNDQEEKARLAELEISIQEAQRQLKRITNLAKNNVASEQLLDEQQAKVKALRAQKVVLETRLDELRVLAPFDGVLGIRNVSLGALVRPGDVITTLDDLNIVKVDFQISEFHLASVSIGQNIKATSVAYPNELFEGIVTSVASRVDPSTRAVQIRAKIANDSLKLRPGMLLQINLQKNTLNTIILPEACLILIEDRHIIYVVEDGKAVEKQVEIGIRKPGVVQIVSGLEVGEQVVLEGALKLKNGSAVNVLNPSVGKG